MRGPSLPVGFAIEVGRSGVRAPPAKPPDPASVRIPFTDITLPYRNPVLATSHPLLAPFFSAPFYFFLNLLLFFIYLLMIVTEREREAET